MAQITLKVNPINTNGDLPSKGATLGGFAESLGVKIQDGPLAGLDARSIVVPDEEGKVIYTQLVSETVDEPDYDSALSALS